MFHSMSRQRVSAAVLSLVLSLILTGCSEDATKPEPAPEPDPRETRVGVIDMFTDAHEAQNITDYEACLHPDYEFWFSEDDRSDPSWDWTDWIAESLDVEITDRMFDAEEITNIQLDLGNLTNVEGAESDEDNFLELDIPLDKEDTLTVYWADFLVDMHVIENMTEYQLDHWVDGRAYIYLAPDPDDECLWTIWRIEDRGNEHRKTEKTTWGSLKCLYR